MEVFNEPLSRRYRAACCSWASLCNFILVVIIIIIPYIWAYTSHSFWLKEGTYREQPWMAFNHKMLVQLNVKDSSLDHEYTALMWSTEPAVNALANQQFRPAMIMANPTDDNGDARPDKFNITVDFPLSRTETVVGVQAIAFFDYELQDRVSGAACVWNQSSEVVVALDYYCSLVWWFAIHLPSYAVV